MRLTRSDNDVENNGISGAHGILLCGLARGDIVGDNRKQRGKGATSQMQLGHSRCLRHDIGITHRMRMVARHVIA
jgi:hypothetical protein